MISRIFLSALIAFGVLRSATAQPLATPRQMANSREDVWGEAAIRQPGGPSYEFFRDLLPPLRYVNTAFKHYPIVLCSPGQSIKARWVSNGSGVNLRAGKPPMWKEVGAPVSFFVGNKSESFGADQERIDGPHYVDGWLPIVQIGYRVEDTHYKQEAFAITRGALADSGVLFVSFTTTKGTGPATVRLNGQVSVEDGVVRDEKGRGILQFDRSWLWDSKKQELRTELTDQAIARLVVFTKLAEHQAKEFPDAARERAHCIETWKGLVGQGASFDIPELVVQNAWRSIVIGNQMIAVGDRMHYSAGNAYDHLYEAECGDAVRSLLAFGHVTQARRMILPLLAFNRQATRFHVAGHKLQLLAHYYWMTRDKKFLTETRTSWQPVLEFIRESRRTANGLLPKDRYAGDIAEAVYSLSSNAACWRGLRDMAAVLEDMGERDNATTYFKDAANYRKAILDAVVKSERRDLTPHFIPIKLFGNEEPHDPLTATRTGSYYDLMIPYVLGSGLFETGSEREGHIIDYLRRHGGLSMGMIRSTPHQGQFQGEPGVNVLYGLRYMQTILNRGDRDHALVGFYGQLAQGMTRDTFIGGEGSRFFHGDRQGRSFYLPPNSASNAMFLITLRGLLIQDIDTNDDGKPDTLRLLDAIPPHWLKNGAKINIEKSPSAFGEVSLRVESHLKAGEVVVHLESPIRRIEKWQLRLPDPPGYHVTSVRSGSEALQRDSEKRINLGERKGSITIRFSVEANHWSPSD